MLDMKKFYLLLRRHGKKSQSKLQTQLRFKADKNEKYSEYQHGSALGLAQAYINVALWVKQCQKEDEK